MDRPVRHVGDDTLQRRIARLIREVKTARSFNGSAEICIGTSIGAVRNDNEDRAVIVFAGYPNSPDRSFALGVLCDGMGGLASGDEAAVLGLSVFTSRVLRTPRLSPAERLRTAVWAANDAVYRQFRGRSGATLSAIFVARSGDLWGTNVGDSRIYGITAEREPIQLTRDDTLAGFLGSDGRGGENLNRLVQFIGMGEGIEPHIVRPERREFRTILLTSDGIHGSAPEAFTHVVRASANNPELIRRLVALNELMGGRDNGTAVTLPTGLDGQSDDGEQGLNLTFWSASDRLEVWIPILAEPSRREGVPSALSDATNTAPSPPVSSPISGAPSQRRASKNPSKKKGKPKRAAKSSRADATRKGAGEDGNLPLDEDDRPSLDIKFPGSN